MQCHEHATSSLIKTACDLWNSGTNNVNRISEILDHHSSTITRYLKIGTELGICSYDSRKAIKDGSRKSVIQLSMNNEYIREFDSIMDAERNLKIFNTGISAVCRGRAKSAGGFKWMYKTDYDNLDNRS